ncbi:MAG: NHLP bacteriocin export ABC transporter permease/ATPase subunit [Bryobacteraceae bacterium]|nr:NHLP bacteriocin export ABC transporter permease/ATPase subunit [Bryobacteraceae bacterium]
MQAIPASSESTAAVRAGAGREFLVHDPEKAWLVEAGSVDLFVVRAENGELRGALRHTLRVGAGAAIFGLPEPETGRRLLARLSPDARVVEASQARLREMAASVETGGAAELLEGWIVAFAGAASGDLAPKAFEALEPGKEIAIGRDAAAVFPREGVVWVAHSEGESRFLGDDRSPLGADEYFPVSAPGWLEARPKARLSGVSTRQMLAADRDAAGLHLFHRLMMARLEENADREEAAESERLRQKARSDASRLDAALRRLGAPLRDRSDAAPLEDEAGNPLLAACRIVGRRLGIAIELPPDARLGGPATVEDIAHASGVRVRRVILSGRWWRTDSGPLVAFFEEGNRPIALIPTSSGRYALHDPAEARPGKVDSRIASKLGPYAFAFYRAFPERRLGAGDLLAFGVRGCGKDLLWIAVFGAAIGVAGLVVPVATGIIFDSVIPGAERQQLFQLSLFLLAMAVCSALFHLARGLAALRLEGKMEASIQAAVWDRLIGLPVQFFRDYSSGDLASRGLGIDQMRQALTGPALSALLSGIFSVLNFALLFYYSWRLAFLALALVTIAVLVTALCGYLQVRRQREITRIRGRIASLALQLIGGISKLRVAGAESRAFAVWAGEFAAQKREALKARGVSNALAVFHAVFPVVCAMLVFYAMAALAEGPGHAALSTGEFLAFYVAFGQYLAAMLQLSAAVVSVAAIVPLYERAKPILETLPEVDRAKCKPGALAGDIEVKRVSFRYRPDAPLVLKDLSLSAPAGKFVAIVGASSSGKSTVFRLLLGFDKPESGAIYYDGQDLAGRDIRAIRRQIGVVLQTSKLITANILQNIIGSAPLTIEDAWEAARMVGFDQDIKAMPMGMHTVVSEGGGGLSGGQRQRLLIARAIVHKPRILLFDEATSALDNETQAVVSRSLEKLQATRVVIAHRLSTIVRADRIFVLDKGAVVESGTYSELMAGGGLFAELATRQLA